MILSTMAQHLSWRDVVLLSGFSGFYMVSAESLYLYFEEAVWCNLIFLDSVVCQYCGGVMYLGVEWKK
ncbi:hypothetical protein BD769DRAFT_1501900 [Suillus cothurnatus]|nr:hypothetical protein BD769DRAFT_1559536 [Suillus cothurnatus]KAG2107352.1 hypothetical protein BD769DRAFT_1501900 [Suillus cothurnatus]